MSLHQIMYISTVVDTVTPQECAAIARKSAANNQRDDVTGLLLFNSRRFLQVLEGPKDAVERIFTRVYGDPRHRAVVKLREGAIDTQGRRAARTGRTFNPRAFHGFSGPAPPRRLIGDHTSPVR